MTRAKTRVRFDDSLQALYEDGNRGGETFLQKTHAIAIDPADGKTLHLPTA